MRSGEPPVVQEQVPLAPLSTLGVGGPARWFMQARDIEAVAFAHRWAKDRELPLFVLGGGSNIVLADSGFDGVVLKVSILGISTEQDGGDTLMIAGAGEAWDPVVRRSVDMGLAGLESLSGIPGSVGGTPIQNVGAYGQEVGETVERVRVYDRSSGKVCTLSGRDCRFAYRMSRFKGDDAGRFIVCEVTFRLREGPAVPRYPDVVSYLERAGIRSPTLAEVRAAVLVVRRRKAMVIDRSDPDTRSVGSFFMNPVVGVADRERIASAAGSEPPAFDAGEGRVKLSAAWLIEHAGFRRGDGEGPVGISSKHTLALVNRGGATARDVLRLASRIKRQVAERFGVWLRPEPVFVGFGADPDVDYLKTEA